MLIFNEWLKVNLFVWNLLSYDVYRENKNLFAYTFRHQFIRSNYLFMHKRYVQIRKGSWNDFVLTIQRQI